MQWFWDKKAVKALRVYGGGALFVRMSLNDGGEVGFEHAEDGGMRARLGGRDVDMMESPSGSSRTDAGCVDSLEIGLWGIGAGAYPRRCAPGILPLTSPTERARNRMCTCQRTNGDLEEKRKESNLPPLHSCRFGVSQPPPILSFGRVATTR